MKKSIAVLMLGSALLLPNNNSVEASGFENKVEVHKVQQVQLGDWKNKQYDLSFSTSLLNLNTFKLVVDYDKSKGKFVINKSKIGKYVFNSDRANWEKPVVEKEENAKPAPTKPVEKPAPTKPAPSTPEVKPEPTKPAQSTPEVKPEPTKPAPSTPEVKPEPTKPVPSTPEVEPAPTNPAPSTPETQPTTPVEQTENASISAIEREVLNLTNVERQKAGLAPLQTDSKLMNSARQKSTDMATNRYFSHTSPTYGSPFDQMKANGVTYRSAAENIAMGQRTAQQVVQGWMESPGHRENILSSSYTHIGIGYDANGHYWTQQFIGK